MPRINIIKFSHLLNWKQRLNIATEVASALNYLHSLNAFHRDVKSANIVINDDLHAKVIGKIAK